MMMMTEAFDETIPPVGSLALMPMGPSPQRVTVIEDRGPLGVGGRHVVRVRFFFEATEEPIETEVPVDELEILALPDAPAEQRTWAEAVGDRWVGTYTDLLGRLAIVTEEMKTEQQARRAARQWARDMGDEAARRSTSAWALDPRYPGRYSVVRVSPLGSVRARATTRA